MPAKGKMNLQLQTWQPWEVVIEIVICHFSDFTACEHYGVSVTVRQKRQALVVQAEPAAFSLLMSPWAIWRYTHQAECRAGAPAVGVLLLCGGRRRASTPSRIRERPRCSRTRWFAWLTPRI